MDANSSDESDSENKRDWLQSARETNEAVGSDRGSIYLIDGQVFPQRWN